MFIGHFGIALGARKFAPALSLGTLFMATAFPDLLWPVFLLLGWERAAIDPGNTALMPIDFVYYPYSHSLVMALVWGILFGLVHYLFKRNRPHAAILGLVVFSHWLLDLPVHGPDLPLLPGLDVKAGFGLWNHPIWELSLETPLYAAGIYLLLRSQRPRGVKGIVSFYSLLVFLALVHVGNLFGPPPEDTQFLAWMALSQWVLVVWAYRAGRCLVPR